jgi:hypothetical protein
MKLVINFDKKNHCGNCSQPLNSDCIFLKCKHSFHVNCSEYSVIECLYKHNKCPLCIEKFSARYCRQKIREAKLTLLLLESFQLE